MACLGRLSLVLGFLLLLLGALLLAASAMDLSLGHLPGDFVFRRGPVRLFFPLASMLVVSLFLSFAANVLRRWLG